MSVLLILAGALTALIFALPILAGMFHAGSLLGLLIGAALLLFGLFRSRLPRGLRRAAGILFGIGAAYVALIGILMLTAGQALPPGEATVIVLGCKVNPSGAPSLLLRLRIDAAAEYLAAHPEAKAICSGGQGAGEPVSEAECIYRELAARGIEEDRLYREDRSENTAENIRLSHEIIRREGLTETMLLVSNQFHLLRAKLIASQQGISAYTLGSATPKSLLPAYFLRECLAIPKELLFGSR